MTAVKENVKPRPLSPGDKIAIVSPSGIPVPKEVEEAAEALRREGWNASIYQYALSKQGSYAGTAEQRYSDLADALSDPNVRAVLCSRGGYGAVHILDRLSKLPLESDPKWLIGFSDITALHSLLVSKGICSIHASMAKHVMLGPDDPDNAILFDILRGNLPALSFPSTAMDRPGIATGTLVGGNVAVFADLISTPFDVIAPGTILFIEDVGEPIYKIERILYQLKLNGVLPKLAGLVVGQFTDYKPDRNYDDMEHMVHDMVATYNYPVAFNAPIGHVFHNSPVVCGAKATLKVTPTEGDNHIIYWP